MKGFIRILSAMLVLALCLSLSALAFAASESALQKSLSKSEEWKGYKIKGQYCDAAAIIDNGKHSALAVYQDGKLTVSVRAVYQRGDAAYDKARIDKTDSGFALSYGDSERYEFALVSGKYLLSEAKVSALRFYINTNAIIEEWGYCSYIAEDASGSTKTGGCYTVSNFNISLFPRSAAEIKETRYKLAALSSGRILLNADDNAPLLSGVGTGKTPVYSSPYGEAAWRAADGKAALGLSGDIWLMGISVSTSGTMYTAVRYVIDEYNRRIGFVLTSQLGKSAKDFSDSFDSLIHVEVRAARDTYLTDDPGSSQRESMAVEAGTCFDCIAIYNDEYAYVSAEVNAKGFTDGGAVVWGFVPLRDIELMDSYPHSQAADEAMEQLEGCWYYSAGGSMAADALTFNPDGSFISGHIAENNVFYIESEGEWQVTEYNSFQNKYWNNPPYEITLIAKDSASVLGLVITPEGFSLTDWEGGAGYERVEAPITYSYDDSEAAGNG